MSNDRDRDEASHEASCNGLWAHGGMPVDPVAAHEFPGPRVGFGALRCAAGALNGGTVATIYFPAGVPHVFC